MHHFVSIQSSSGALVALTHSGYNFAKKIAGLKGFFSSGKDGRWPDELQWLAVDDVIKASKKLVTATSATKALLPTKPTGVDESISFLQYTSGSTSEPKGVMISHRNLAHNHKLIAHELKTTPSTVCVSWLPQYHDMGLIGSYLGTIDCGGEGVYISPISFLKDPTLWIRTMSKYKATHTQAPSFAFALSARKFAEFSSSSRGTTAPALDLSSLQHMINAAEPVDPVAVSNFYAMFKPFGLPGDVIIPTYGLAEHTVFVCSGGKQSLHVDKVMLEDDKVRLVAESDPCSRTIIGCGFPGNAEGVEMRIVSPSSMEVLADDLVGEIWVDSPSKAMGYWNRPEVTATDFNATTSSAGDTRKYLRTGDLGFMHNKELFICGRLKDLLILRGSNHYPQDIERTAEQCEVGKDWLRAGCSAAFTVSGGTDGTEMLIYIAEAKENLDNAKLKRVLQGCQDAIVAAHGITVSHLCILKPRTIPKTTSGKIARSWCRKAYLAKTLSILSSTDINFMTSRATEESSIALNTPDSSTALGIDVSEEDAKALAPAAILQMPELSPEETRALSLEEIVSIIEDALVDITGGVTSKPVDRACPVGQLGLDSVVLMQLSGVIQNRLHCPIPDDFMFTSAATLQGLSTAVKKGGLTEQQQHQLEAAQNGEGGAGEGMESIEVVNLKQPMCPWFYCCY